MYFLQKSTNFLLKKNIIFYYLIKKLNSQTKGLMTNKIIQKTKIITRTNNKVIVISSCSEIVVNLIKVELIIILTLLYFPLKLKKVMLKENILI